MKKLLLLPLLLLVFAVGGCASPGGSSPFTQENVDKVVAQVQSVTTATCKFVPTAQTVANILDALGVKGASAVTDVAAQICSAVTKVGARRGQVPKIRGVVVRGKFVR